MQPELSKKCRKSKRHEKISSTPNDTNKPFFSIQFKIAVSTSLNSANVLAYSESIFVHNNSKHGKGAATATSKIHVSKTNEGI